MSNEQLFREALARRSQAQGVVTRHMNTLKKIVGRALRPKPGQCEETIDKLLKAKERYDDAHGKALQSGFLAGIDTTEMEEASLLMGTEVLRACDAGQAWLMGCSESRSETAPDYHAPGPAGNETVAAMGDRLDSSVVGVQETVKSPGGEWKERYLNLKYQHESETTELRQSVEMLRRELEMMRDAMSAPSRRETSTPEGSSRRVTFGLDSRLDIRRASTVENGKTSAGSDQAGPMDLRVRGSVAAGETYSVPPVSGTRGYTPLETLHEGKISPTRPYTVEGGHREWKPLGRSGFDTQSSQHSCVSDYRDLEVHQRLLNQSEAQHRSMMAALHTPMTKLSKFDGDPLEYSAFINTFDDLVDANVEGARARLSSLLSHCEGRALRAIRWCAHKGAEQGYHEARRVLAQKFGSPFVVSQAWLNKLLGYPNLRTPDDLEAFACDLVCCRESLSALGYIQELQCTNTLRLIVAKLPIHLRNQWRKAHREGLVEGDGSMLARLIRLVDNAAQDVTDPAFSERAIEKVKNSYQQNVDQTRRGGGFSFKRAAVNAVERGASVDDLLSMDCTEEDELPAPAVTLATRGSTRPTCALCPNAQHFTSKCRKYKEFRPEQRLALVTEKSLCRLCLSMGHQVDSCNLPWKCQERGCSGRHHTSLHAAVSPTADVPTQSINALQITASPRQLSDATCCLAMTAPCLPVTTVEVYGNGRSYTTYALLDNASTITLSTSALHRKLGVKPVGRSTLEINTVNGPSGLEGDVIRFEVRGVKLEKKLPVFQATTLDRLPISMEHMATAKSLLNWEHLAGLDLPMAKSEQIDLLIGQDNAHLLEPMGKLKGKELYQPYAVMTPLGWTIYGLRSGGDGGRHESVNTCAASPLIDRVRDSIFGRDAPGPCELVSDPTAMGPGDGLVAGVDGASYGTCSAELGKIKKPDPTEVVQSVELPRVRFGPDPPGELRAHDEPGEVIPQSVGEILEGFWKLEEVPSASRFTREEQAILDLWDREFKVVDGRVTLPIPFRKRPPGFPDNYTMALRSFLSLGKRLKKDLKKLKQYVKAVMDDIINGHARRVRHKGRLGWTWYLLHHGVDHDRKPDVTRVVKNGAAEFMGISLNSMAYQGPDLMNKLIGVLSRFRQFRCATVSDIEGMFNQVMVPEDERDCQRFLFWENGDPEGEIVEYQMCTHTFGTTWAPAAAMYALRKCAEIHQSMYPEKIIQSVQRNFYVDDWHRSDPDETEAVHSARNVTELVGRVSFNLRKFASNSRRVIESVDEAKRAKELHNIDLLRDRLPKGFTLGLGWDPEEDAFYFKLVPEPRPLTRRGLMSSVASLYDPLGLVAPFIIPAKILLQQTCRTGLGWDDELPAEVVPIWSRWLSDLTILAELRIPRWLQITVHTINTLHHFGDASQRAYGGASYMLVESQEGQVMDCRLVMGKSKVAPLRTQSIPRLELCAAVMVTKMDESLREEFTVALQPSHFWTDSAIVMFYIYGDPANYKPFMANRVAKIQGTSSCKQWDHVPGVSNPADLVSRGTTADQLLESDMWVNGPEFLRQGKTAWPTQTRVTQKEVGNEEIRKNKAVMAILATSTRAAQAELKGSGATGEKTQACFLAKCSAQEVEEAQAEMVDSKRKAELDSEFKRLVDKAESLSKLKRQFAWLDRFARWYAFKKGKSSQMVTRGPLTAEDMIRAHSNLIRVTQRWHLYVSTVKSKVMKRLAITEEDGIWRIGGRLDRSAINPQLKHPVVIPGGSSFARLLIKEAHYAAMHPGIDRTLMEVRRGYWITQGRKVAKRFVNGCVLCCRMRGKAMSQRMADVPHKRADINTPPFFHTGVDLFGPLQVAVRRSREKRYGVLYTCFGTRAVHLEVAVDLSTSAFLSTFERFTSRRGTPSTMQSDRGTNFIGGRRELREVEKLLSNDKIGKRMADEHIRWSLNSPAASHQGGIWERMIREVRKALMAVLGNEVVTEDRLRTTLCKIEYVINSRPITKLCDDPTSMTPLCPNDLLIMKAPRVVFPVKFSGDRYRHDWRQARHLVGEFWKVWVAKYLPLLQRRAKWTDVKKNLRKGELIILINDQLHRSAWPVGLVKEVYPGADGLVRNALIRTAQGEFVRPVQKLVRLEGDDEEVT